MNKPLYITCAIDYVNSRPHIGTAYEKIGADCMARFARLSGREVRLQLGNDEHSVNVAKSAQKSGLDPLKYCDQMENEFRRTWDKLDIAYDGFIRTTTPAHKDAVRALFTLINSRTAPDGSPNIYKSKYTGWYCDSCEAFYTDKDLVEEKCPVHGIECKWVEEENYFFALSKYADFLIKHFEDNPTFILPDIRRNEIVSLLRDGLQDISVSREGGDWGIKLPIDEKHTVYVWFDALINYITAIGYPNNEKDFAKWWTDAEVVHVIGKDITRFHCVIWPAMLQAAGLAQPRTVLGHGFVYHRGERMSKTLGNVVSPLDLAEQYGADPLRYFLLRENSFGRDGNFTWEQFIERYNADLANGIGNLVSRTMGMVKRYLNNTLPANSEWKPDSTLVNAVQEMTEKATSSMNYASGDVDFHDALGAIFATVSAADKFINDNEPWNLQKTGKSEELFSVLANVTAVIRCVTIMLQAYTPTTAEKIWEQMGFATRFGKIQEQQIKDAKDLNIFSKDLALGEMCALFPRIEVTDNQTEQLASKPKSKTERNKMEAVEKISEVVEGVAQISIQDFTKVDLRVATIKQVEKIEGADKLLKLQLEVGEETRQIVAGIAMHYTPEDLVGKQVCVVFNLKPAKLRGVESQGMLLAASDADTVSILTPLRPVASGSKVK